jgi:hypothetical protein
MKLLIVTALVCAAVLGFDGCVDYVGVGYSDAYYVPDYRPFYAEYFYNGVPYWGPDIDYVRKKVVIRDVDKRINLNKNIYYGGHHIVRDWRGPRRTGVGVPRKQLKLPSYQRIRLRS